MQSFKDFLESGNNATTNTAPKLPSFSDFLETSNIPPEPTFLDKVSGFNQAVNQGPIGKVADIINKGVGAVVSHPLDTLIGAGKGAINAGFNIVKGLTRSLGADKATEILKSNQDVMNQEIAANLKTDNEHTASAIGNFVGEQWPYLLAGEVAGGVGTKLAGAGIDTLGGGLSLKAASKIGDLTRRASSVAGFIGLDQLTLDPQEEARTASLKKDLLFLGVLESVSYGIGAYSELKAIKNIRSYLEKIKTEKPPVSEIENTVAKLKTELQTETGKTPEELLQTAYPKSGTPSVAPSVAETPLAQEARGVAKTPEILPTPTEPIKVSRSQLPVGTGETKVSALEARVKGIEDSLKAAPEEVKNLSTYSQMNNKQQIDSAVKYVQENGYDEALKVLTGEKPEPKGILKNSIYVAMTKDAETNSELAAKLASLRSTRYGQEIQILSQVERDNPVKYLTDLSEAKIEAFGREKLATLKTQEIGAVKKAISVSQLAKTDWNAFVDSITC